MTKRILLLGSCAMMANAPSQAQDTSASTDWVERYGQMQAANSYEYLSDCWVGQWPEGVPGSRDDPETWPAQSQLDEVIARTRRKCTLQMEVRLDQILVDLAREGLIPPTLQEQAQTSLEEELENFLEVYYARQ